MKQIIIDYDEYLRLESADDKLQKIIRAATPGVIVVQKHSTPDPYAEIVSDVKLEVSKELIDAILDALALDINKRLI